MEIFSALLELLGEFALKFFNRIFRTKLVFRSGGHQNTGCLFIIFFVMLLAGFVAALQTCISWLLYLNTWLHHVF